jgi:hypothetical protein
MGNKRSRHASDSPAKGDNFKLIAGISSGVEMRLHKAGILTYAQLAALPLEDLLTIVAGYPGINAERITKQNWIGQARDLALKSEPAADQPAGKKRSKSNQEYATFDTELRLDRDNNILQTHVLHVQSGTEEEWDGWQEEKLVRFISQFARLPIEETPVQSRSPQLAAEAAPENLVEERLTASPDIAPPDEAPVLPSSAPSAPAGTATNGAPRESRFPASPLAAAWAHQSLVTEAIESAPRAAAMAPSREHKMEILLRETASPARLISSDQHFDIHLSLNLLNLAGTLPGDPFDYIAVIQARVLAGEKSRITHQIAGRIQTPDQASITFQGMNLPPGTYLLSATVRLSQPLVRSPLHINLEGGLIQIY